VKNLAALENTTAHLAVLLRPRPAEQPDRFGNQNEFPPASGFMLADSEGNERTGSAMTQARRE
jgi:hypothetical protein